MLKPLFQCLQVQMALSSLSATLQAAKGRLDGLEQMRIPTLEERLQEVSRTSAQVGFARVCHVQYHYAGIASLEPMLQTCGSCTGPIHLSNNHSASCGSCICTIGLTNCFRAVSTQEL